MGLQQRLTVGLHSPRQPQMSPTDGRHPPAPMPRCSCFQAEACCAARSLGPRGATRSRHIHQPQPLVAGVWHGVQCKAIHITESGARRFISRRSVQGDSYHGDRCKAIHITGFCARRFVSWGSERDNSTAWTHLAERGVEPLLAITAGPCSGRGPTRVPYSGDDTSHRVVASTPHDGSIKGWVAVPLVSFLPIVLAHHSCPSFLLIVPARRSCLSFLPVVPACRSCPSFLSIVPSRYSC